jgi:hypothetical protein
MIRGGPDALVVRTLAGSSPVTFDDPEDLLAAMGIGLDATG